MKVSEIKPEVREMAVRAQARCLARFAEIDAVAEENTRRVMEAFQDQRVSDSCFAGTTGYGYDGAGKPWTVSMRRSSAPRPRLSALASSTVHTP